MTTLPRRLRVAALAGWVLAGWVLAVATLGAAPPALAGEPTSSLMAATSGTGPSIVARPATRQPDQSLSMDRSSRVFAATGYQTLTMVGLVGGAAAIGALAGGVSGALTAGGAVLLGYIFMR